MPYTEWSRAPELADRGHGFLGRRMWLALLTVVLTLSPGAGTAQVDDSHIYWYTILDRFEYGFQDSEELLLWEAQAWIGGDYDKVWLKAEGEFLTEGGEGTAELQALWSHLISPFWDFQVGTRVDFARADGIEKARAFAVIGFEGLAPYWFELEPALFVSHEGDVSLRFTASYDMFLTQRLILQGRIEGEVAAQSVPEFGVGSGLVGTETGLRVRYEVRRKFAPYLGWRWKRVYQDTADLAREAGTPVAGGYLVSGVRFWF